MYKEKLGLLDPTWTSYGKEWRSLASLWLRAESALAKSGRADLKFAEINHSSLPQAIKDWMVHALMRVDAMPPRGDGFGAIWTSFLKSLPISEWKDNDGVLEQVWCRTGTTGIVFLVLGLFWQAEYSGAGKEWTSNMRRVHDIFECILSALEL